MKNRNSMPLGKRLVCFISIMTLMSYMLIPLRAYATINLSENNIVESAESDEATDDGDNLHHGGIIEEAGTSDDDNVEWETVEISTAEELIDFASKCNYNSYSENKIVKLTSDITLAGSGYEPMAIFCGVFDGGGHKIEGFLYSDTRSFAGFICKTTPSATVMNLTIGGNITPANRQMVMGGIVGDNYGLIKNCKYVGIVKGHDYVGGITGYNESVGRVMDCSSYGQISGQHYVGGIAGANAGGIYRCTNEADINTTNEDKKADFDDIDVDKYLGGILDISGKGSEAKEINAANSSIDIGGIAGYSMGVVEYCNNPGNVGYEHVGYNVGGIVGRQSGYVHGCTNEGKILGRKDVGGIVGQAEPYVDMDLSEDTISKLTTNINELHDLISGTLTDSDNQSDVITERLSLIQKFTNDALADIDYLSGETINWANGMTGAANDVLGRVDYVIDESSKDGGAIDQSRNAASNVGKAADALADAADAANIYNYMSDEETVRYDAAKNRIKTNGDEYNGYYEEYLENNPGDTAGAKAYANAEYAAAHPTHTYEGDVKDDADIMAEIIAAHEGEMSSDAAQSTQSAMDALSDAGDNLSEAASDVDGIVDNLSGRDDIALPYLSDGYKSRTSSFMAALQGMSDNMGQLNNELNNSSSVLTDDMQKVNDSFNSIMLLFTDALSTALNMDYEAIYEDESLDVALNSTQGTIADCTNNGTVYGDIDTAGIAGTMAIEYDFDLESDTTGIKDSKAGAVYKTKCVLRDDVNNGRITSHKSYAGGQTGLQEMGIITGCANYGRIVSTSGGYVGGIAGSSVSDIHNSYSKCILSGSQYIGGIAGYGCNIRQCVSMPSINDGDSFIGAIAGEVSDNYHIEDNHFCSKTLGGIDRISYEGMAAPVSYDELCRIPGIPVDFKTIVVAFLSGDDEVGRVNIGYGESIGPDMYPESYVDEEHYIKWNTNGLDDITEDAEITGEECRFLTTIASSRLRGNGQSVILADGRFKDGQELICDEYKDIPDGEDVSDSVAGKLIERWEVTIPDDGSASHRIRVQAPDGIKSYDIYIDNGNGYYKMPAEKMGMYETVLAEGNNMSLLLINTSIPKWVYCTCGVIAGIIVLYAVILLIRNSKSGIKSEGNNTKEENNGDTK